MLIENQVFKFSLAKIHKKNKEHILNKGYKENDGFVTVKAEDLPLGSKIQVELSCDRVELDLDNHLMKISNIQTISLL